LLASLTNVLLNGNVYQQLLNYQSGIGLAQVVNRNHIPKNDVYNFNHHSSGFNFYAQHLNKAITLADIKAMRAEGKPVWLLTTADSRQTLINHGFRFKTVYSDVDFGITRLNKDFLNPATRSQVCVTDYLIEIM